MTMAEMVEKKRLLALAGERLAAAAEELTRARVFLLTAGEEKMQRVLKKKASGLRTAAKALANGDVEAALDAVTA